MSTAAQAKFLDQIVAALDTSQIPYMVVGSLASTLYGIPRATQDIDLVIDPSPPRLRKLVAAMPEDEFHVDADEAQSALGERSQFNVLAFSAGWKAALIVRKDREFSVIEFSRRVDADVLGVPFKVASPEDTVLAKLEWARMSGSQRQIDDAAGVLRVSAEAIDVTHLDAWAAVLDVTEQLAEARRRSRE